MPVILVRLFTVCMAVVVLAPGISFALEEADRREYRYGGGQFEQPLLVVRVGFGDILPAYSDAEVGDLFFGSGNSVRDFYLNSSEQNFRITPADGIADGGIVDIVLPYPHPDFGRSAGSGNSRNLMVDVLGALDEAGYGEAFGQYDRNHDGWLDGNELALVVFLAGYEQAVAGGLSPHPNIWAHQGLLASGTVGAIHMTTYVMAGELHNDHLATIGLLCHELGHLLLGLPDLIPEYGIAEGVGRRGLMALGGWNGSSAGETPSALLGWSREVTSIPAAPGVRRIDLDPYRHGRYLLLESRPHPVTGLPEAVLLDVNGSAGLSRFDNVILPLDNSNPIITLTSGTAVTSLASVSSNDNSQTLATLNWSGEVLTSFEESSVVGGFVGDGNIPADSGWIPRFSGEQWQQIVELDVSHRWQWLDGIDLLVIEEGSIDVELRDPDSGVLLAHATVSQAAPGWKRMLFDYPVEVPIASAVAVIVSSQEGSAVLGSRLADGFADNNWRGEGYAWLTADRHLMMALLVRATISTPIAAPDAEPIVDSVTTDVSAAPASGSSSGNSGGESGGSGGGSGGGFLEPWWLVPGFWMWRRLRKAEHQGRAGRRAI